MNAQSLPAGKVHMWGNFAMLFLVLMEAFWITDWYSAFAHPRAGWVGVDGFVTATLLSTHLLARFSSGWKISLRFRRAIFSLWLLVPIFAGFPLLVFAGEPLNLGQMWGRITNTFFSLNSDLSEFWHILILLLVMLRGLRLARGPLEIYTPQASFQLGLYLLLLYGLIFSWQRPEQALLTTYGFLFCAVAAMSATRISTLSELRGGRLPPMRFPWLIGILSIAAIIVGIGIAIGWLSTNIINEVIAAAYTFIFAILIIAGLIILSPVLLLILSMGPTLRDLIDTLSHIGAFNNIRTLIENAATKLGITPELIEGVVRTSRPLVLLAVLSGVILLVLIAVVWKPWQRHWIQEDAASSLPLRAALRFPRLLLRRFSGRLPSGSRALAAARIRLIYAQFMELCSYLGQPRRPSTTPLEYLPEAKILFPENEASLAAITQAYLKVRYGELPETYEELQAVLSGWEQIKAKGKKRLSTRRKSKR